MWFMYGMHYIYNGIKCVHLSWMGDMIDELTSPMFSSPILPPPLGLFILPSPHTPPLIQPLALPHPNAYCLWRCCQPGGRCPSELLVAKLIYLMCPQAALLWGFSCYKNLLLDWWFTDDKMQTNRKNYHIDKLLKELFFSPPSSSVWYYVTVAVWTVLLGWIFSDDVK